MRLTKHRQEILTVLQNSHQAQSANDIHRTLPHINLVTIYRSLDTFAEAGMIKKLHLGESEASYEIQTTPHHHAICNDCNQIIHFTINENALLKYLAFPNFKITDIDITVRGHCKSNHLDKQNRSQPQQAQKTKDIGRSSNENTRH